MLNKLPPKVVSLLVALAVMALLQGAEYLFQQDFSEQIQQIWDLFMGAAGAASGFAAHNYLTTEN